MHSTPDPHVNAYVLIPGDCEVSCSFSGIARDVEMQLGDRHDCFEMLFERKALVRFVEVASRALAVPVPIDPKTEMPTLTSVQMS